MEAAGGSIQATHLCVLVHGVRFSPYLGDAAILTRQSFGETLLI